MQLSKMTALGGQLYTPQTGDTTSDPVATFSGQKSDLSNLIKSAHQGLSCMYSKYYAAGPANENGVNSQYYVHYTGDSKAGSATFGGGCGSLSWSGDNSDLKGQMVRSVITDLSSSIQVDQCLAAGKGKGTCKIAAMTGQGSSDKQAAVTQAFVTAYNINRDFITNTTTKSLYKTDLKTAGLTSDDQPSYSGEQGGSWGDETTDKNPIGQGWIMAGSYFWDIVNLSYSDTVNADYNPSITATGITGDHILDSTTITNAETAASKQVAGAGPQAQAYDFDGSINSQAEIKLNDAMAGWSADAAGTTIMGGLFAPLISAPLLMAMNTIPMQFDVQGDGLSLHPIVVVQRVGEACLSAGKIGLFATMALVTAASMFFGMCSAESPEATMWNIGVEWMKPIIQTIATGLIAVGAMLTFYVPLYPFFVYMFAAVGWFVAVLEAMVAAPLVCLGLTHPEGHDFLGKSEQALMLLLGVFLRPVLLVIGFLAAIAVSWAAFGLLNLGFAHIINTMSSGFSSTPLSGNSVQQVMEAVVKNYSNGMASSANGMTGGDTQYLITLPLLMIIYAIFVFNMLTVAFKPITMYVDILKWIGGPQSNDAAEQTAQKMQGSIQSAASGAAGLMGKASGAGSPQGTQEKIARYGIEKKKRDDAAANRMK